MTDVLETQTAQDAPEATPFDPPPAPQPIMLSCQFCGRKCAGERSKAIHEVWCHDNPNRRTTKFTKRRKDFGKKRAPYKARAVKLMAGGASEQNGNDADWKIIHGLLHMLKIGGIAPTVVSRKLAELL